VAIAFVVVVIFFLCRFAPQIAELITRIRKVGPTGARAFRRNEKQSVEQQTTAVSVAQSTQRLLKAFNPPAVLQREEAIRSSLRAERLDDQSDTANVLIHHLAHVQVAWHCEYIYRLIFGSQIALLKALNTSGPVSETDSVTLYKSIAQPDFPIDHTWYFSFLLAQGLVRNENGSFVITDLGNDFLQWLVKASVPENKPY
jgi:hypothetical protein